MKTNTLGELNYTRDDSKRQGCEHRTLRSAARLTRLKQRKMRRFKRDALNVLTVLGIALYAWIALSYVDIVLHNVRPNPVYQAWNFFTLIFK